MTTTAHATWPRPRRRSSHHRRPHRCPTRFPRSCHRACPICHPQINAPFRWHVPASLRALWLPLCVIALAIMTSACGEEPVVTLGGPVDADVLTDEDSTVDEAERERLFRDLAERECREDEPVCADDGNTYRNLCQAIANGAQVVHPGAC